MKRTIDKITNYSVTTKAQQMYTAEYKQLTISKFLL